MSNMSDSDPHAIYDQYLYLFEEHFGRDCILVKRLSGRLTKFGYFGRAADLVVRDLQVVMHVIMNASSNLLIVREFSAKVLLVFSVLLFHARRRVVFNINHNLNSRIDFHIVSFLSNFFSFAMVGSGSDIKAQLPRIHHLRFSCKWQPTHNKQRKMLIFLGSRAEQRMERLEQFCKVIEGAARTQELDVMYIGLNRRVFGSLLGGTDYLNSLGDAVRGCCTVFLYSPSQYRHRHSGVFWELLSSANTVVYPATDVLLATAECRGAHAFSFSSSDLLDFRAALDASLSLHLKGNSLGSSE